MISRTVLGERLVLFGWGQAILLQLAHPLVAAGVHDHTSIHGGKRAQLQRLHGTVQSMLALTFGSESQAQAAATRITRIHDRVAGTLRVQTRAFAAGTRYTAHDPALLRWVHATLLVALPATYELLVGPLTVAERDCYCREARSIGPRLGIAEDQLPGSVSELDHYVQQVLASGVLQVTPAARELSGAILAPPLRTVAWPAARLNWMTTVGGLPPEIRDGYGVRWTASDAEALAHAATLVRRARRWSPASIARWRAGRDSPAPTV